MDCTFCTEFAGNGHREGRIISEHEGWVLIPTVGCFVPGYCLFMPTDHVDAAADLDSRRLAEVELAVEGVRDRISAVFGPTILAEHGSRDCQLGAGCCTHCHLHLIPVSRPDAVAQAYRSTGGSPTLLDRLADLTTAVHGPYLYLSPQPGEHMLWLADSRFARQFVRRVCAQSHGLADKYDWREFPFQSNQNLTLDVMRAVTEVVH